MSKPNEERDIYYIPPNFLASGRLFGGMIRARNAIEACVLVLLTGIPIIKLPMSLTVRIIILCLLPLPLGIFGIIGFEGDSLSEFAINWVRWFIIPCQGVSAVYLDDDGDSEICPCAFVMLMSDGKIEPFVFATDKDIERIANKGHTGFTGFVPTK